MVRAADRVIDDLASGTLAATVGSRWQLISDRVMGGISAGTLRRETVAGQQALRMRGEVSLENNGGFVQMALDLAPDGAPVDASAWTGLELDVLGNDEDYGVHLRTDAVARPWQSYRQGFHADRGWRTVRLPFAGFVAHRIEVPLDVRRLRRLGLVAIGRAFTADLAVGGVRFFGNPAGTAPTPAG